MKQKIIVIGLGNFGGNLAIKLTQDGHEVFGVDVNTNKVNLICSKIDHAIGIDTTEESSMAHLPFSDTDIVVIAIGEDIGASISSTALIKKHFKGRLIARSISPVHKTILQAMEIHEIIEPESEYALDLANRILLKGATKSMDLYGDFEIIEVIIPKKVVGKTLAELDIKNTYNIHIVTTIKRHGKENYLGGLAIDKQVYGILRSTYVFEEGDLLLIFGIKENIEKFINNNY